MSADGVIGEARGLPLRDRPGILLPGLVNAHTHLELAPGTMPAGLGLPTWVRMLRAGPPPSAAQAGRGVLAAIAAGTAAVAEVSNSGLSFPAIEAAGLRGRPFHEVLGIDVDQLPPLRGRPVPHGPHSTSTALIAACAARPEPWSIHVDEGEEERQFVATGGGSWADFMRAAGRDPGRFRATGLSPIQQLEPWLSPRSLLVHCTLSTGPDLDRIAAAGASVCLCPRSNRFITGRLPDVPGMIARGIRLAIGTDSLASSPDLDPLAEAAALRAAFPAVDPRRWLRALTLGDRKSVV